MGPFLGSAFGWVSGGAFRGSARLEEGGGKKENAWPVIEGCPGLCGCWGVCFLRDTVRLSFRVVFVLLFCTVWITPECFQPFFGLHITAAISLGDGLKVQGCIAMLGSTL